MPAGAERLSFHEFVCHLSVLAGMSASDAVDGSSTGTLSAMDVGAVDAPTIRRSQSCKG